MIYMKLIKYLFYIFMLLGVTGVWAQKSDIRLGKLLNNGDWFNATLPIKDLLFCAS